MRVRRLRICCIVTALAVSLGIARVQGAESVDPGYDTWGGWRGVTMTATGRFRVERQNGVWWLVTPDGHGFFSAGVDHLRPGGDFSPPLGTAPYHDNILAKYGSEAAWATATRARLGDIGINTVGAFSEPERFAGTIAYTVTLFLSRHAPEVAGVPPALVDRVTRDYYDASFASGVATEVGTAGPACAADPWCVGVFTENEMPLGQSLAQPFPYMDAYLLLPSGAPGKVALQAFLEARYAGDVGAFNAVWGLGLATFDDLQGVTSLTPAPSNPPASPTGSPAQIADRRAFDVEVATRFHTVTHDAIRAASPDVLILGSRLLILSTRPEVVEAIAPYVDVLTVNYYEIAASILVLAPDYPRDYGIAFARMFDDLDVMHRLAGKPILIGEFSYRAADAGLPNTLPPFFPTLATQADRAQAAGTYYRRVIARPYVVGAHWFQYMDQPATGRPDGENQNFGLVNITDDLWPALTDRLRDVLGTAAPRRLLAPGGRRSTDCVVEWGATAAPTVARPGRLPPTRFVCRDGDSACDTDSVPDQCTIEIQPCASVPDARLATCVPASPDSVRVVFPTVEGGADLHDAVTASLTTVASAAVAAPASCGPAVPIVIPLEGHGHRRARLRTAAVAGEAADRDGVAVSCLAAH